MTALIEDRVNRILPETQLKFSLKPEQFKINNSIVNKRDTFAVLPKF